MGRSRDVLFVRDAADGHVLAEAPTADVCAWRGDELILAVRDRESARIRLRAADGTVREVAELTGDLAGVAIDRRGRIVVAQNPLTTSGVAGALVTITDDGHATVGLRARPGEHYQHLADTALGVVVTRVVVRTRVVVAAAAPPPGPAPALRTLPLDLAPIGPPIWLDDTRVLAGDATRALRLRVDGTPDPTPPQPVAGAVIDRDGDALWSTSRVEAGPGVPDARCTLRATRGADVRVVAQWRCADRIGLTCAHGACVTGLIVGDEVWLSPLDRADGSLSPAVITRPLADQPFVAIGPDGRWLVVSGGTVAIVVPATGATTPIATPGFRPHAAAWGHDGSYLVAATRTALARVDLTGAVTILATDPSTNLGPPRVSPGGTWVATQAYDRSADFLEAQ